MTLKTSLVFNNLWLKVEGVNSSIRWDYISIYTTGFPTLIIYASLQIMLVDNAIRHTSSKSDIFEPKTCLYNF